MSNFPEWANVQSAGGERYLPVYLLLNISESMKGAPIESVRQGLELFQREVSTDSFARDVVKVGVITFSNESQLVTNGLIHISKFFPPHLVADDRRSRLDLAFKLSLQSMDRDVKKGIKDGSKGDWKPAIFVLTDSLPTDENGDVTDLLWIPARDALFYRPKGQIKPSSIVAMGVGPNMDDTTLRNISTGTAFKMGKDAAAFVTLFQYLSQSISVSVQ